MVFEVYIEIDDNNYVVNINSSEFLEDTTDWIKIDEGSGDKYHHAQGNYLPESLYTDSGVYRYKYVDSLIIECTAEEIAEQEALVPSPPPSDQERITELEAMVNALLGVSE